MTDLGPVSRGAQPPVDHLSPTHPPRTSRHQRHLLFRLGLLLVLGAAEQFRQLTALGRRGLGGGRRRQYHSLLSVGVQLQLGLRRHRHLLGAPQPPSDATEQTATGRDTLRLRRRGSALCGLGGVRRWGDGARRRLRPRSGGGRHRRRVRNRIGHRPARWREHASVGLGFTARFGNWW